MMDATDSAGSASSFPWSSTWREIVLPGWLFAVLALLLFAFLILLGLLAVVSTTYLGSETDSPDRTFDRWWALLSMLALLWALTNLFWLAKAAELKKATAVYGHLAIALGCGLIAVGIDFVLFARAIGSQPIVMDYSNQVAGAGIAAAQPAVAVEGDIEEGRKIFSTACITCHGPTGGGMPNLAPSLRGSSFIASADAAAIGNVIRLGRAATDPNNKTKKVMPARGGNPFLGDDKIVHLVAFVQAIQNEDPASVAGDRDPHAPPPVQLARWVVPAAPRPPVGIVQLESRADTGDALSIASRSQQRRSNLVRTFALSLSGIHCLLLIGVMMASSNVLIRDLLNDSPRLLNEASGKDNVLWTWSTLGWVVVTFVWLVVFLFGFVMT